MIDLEWHLNRAIFTGNRRFIEHVSDLRWQLYSAMCKKDWQLYNMYARQLNSLGATIALHSVPPEFPKENQQMGMFDSPKYLTGDEGYVDEGDIFWLHNARTQGMVRIQGTDKEQVKLLVSREREGEKTVVLTAGAAIVNQVKRMDADDRAKMPMEVRLDKIPSRQGSPTNILTPADEPPATGHTAAATTGGDDF